MITLDQEVLEWKSLKKVSQSEAFGYPIHATSCHISRKLSKLLKNAYLVSYQSHPILFRVVLLLCRRYSLGILDPDDRAFLNEVQLIWIQHFSSPKLVAHQDWKIKSALSFIHRLTKGR